MELGLLILAILIHQLAWIIYGAISR